jgi:hypothetical protein
MVWKVDRARASVAHGDVLLTSHKNVRRKVKRLKAGGREQEELHVKGSSEPLTLEVAARLVDGTVMRGFIVAGITGQLEQTLNKDSQFIEFIGPDGRRAFISKSQLAAVEPVEALKKPQLQPRKAGSATCYELLGVDENCDFDTARDAYHRLVKMYHPGHVCKWRSAA